MQHPEQQIVTDRVWHELAFGLENLGVPQDIMRRRIAEIASYFGMEDWLEQDPAVLSGGQKQILNLASVMIMQPKLLLLDEPTAQLDPIAAADFFTTLQRLNRDFSVTILLAEHRLEEVIPQADRLLILEQGTVTCCGTPAAVLRKLAPDAPVMAGMPAAVRLYHAAKGTGECPLSVNDARTKLMPQFARHITELPDPPAPPQRDEALRFREVFFRYDHVLNQLIYIFHSLYHIFLILLENLLYLHLLISLGYILMIHMLILKMLNLYFHFLLIVRLPLKILLLLFHELFLNSLICSYLVNYCLK